MQQFPRTHKKNLNAQVYQMKTNPPITQHIFMGPQKLPFPFSTPHIVYYTTVIISLNYKIILNYGVKIVSTIYNIDVK